jgi:hypothetical protein
VAVAACAWSVGSSGAAVQDAQRKTSTAPKTSEYDFDIFLLTYFGN